MCIYVEEATQCPQYLFSFFLLVIEGFLLVIEDYLVIDYIVQPLGKVYPARW